MNATTRNTPKSDAADAIAALFVPGVRVAVCTAANGGEETTGTISATSKGWHVVELDDPEAFPACKNGVVSARLSSLRLLGGEADEEGCVLNADEDEQEPEDDESQHESGEADPDAADADDVEQALEEAEEHASKMAEALRKARVRYRKDKRPNGAATAHCDDLIARELRDYDPLEVAGIADRCFDLPKGTHAAKYEHLNNGQIRMNCGNKIRAVWRKAEDLERMQRIAQVLGLEDELVEMLAAAPNGCDGTDPDGE